ncbi:MAG: helix-turn-helix domain-containing protein [Polyangiaceae bacterium]
MPLAEHFLHGYGATELSAAAKQSLLEHSWPGNIRELANAIERASVLARGAVLEPVDLDLEVVESRRRASLGEMVSLADIEREHIAQVISQAPTLEAAARSLGIDPTTLQRKRKRYGLS